MKYKWFSPLHYTLENIRFIKAKEKFNLQYIYVALCVLASWSFKPWQRLSVRNKAKNLEKHH